MGKLFARLTKLVSVVCSSLICATALAETKILIATSLGDIGLVLYADKAPLTVKNFLEHVDRGGYEGLIFHRVIEGFMIQSGGYKKDLSESESDVTVQSEADNGLRNLLGTIAMARSDEIDSASQQFFINTEDNIRLDHSEKSCTREDEAVRLKALERGLNKPRDCANFGYTVFGHVISGMNVVRAIESSPTEDKEDFYDLPIETITIKSIRRDSSEMSEMLKR